MNTTYVFHAIKRASEERRKDYTLLICILTVHKDLTDLSCLIGYKLE